MPNANGRHEFGQNFLADPVAIDRIVQLVVVRPGPIVEWGTGDGAITTRLATLNRPIIGVEIDPRRARDLDRRTGPHVCIAEGDILRHAPPTGAVVVSNVPFNLTTPILRHLLQSPQWSSTVLITQWEVARKRAAVGGTSLLTAQWWPWFEFALDRRIPATAFRPRPSVDAGILLVDRRPAPLLPANQTRDFQRWLGGVFSSKGRGIADILVRQGVSRPVAQEIAARRRHANRPVLPKDLQAEDWVTAFTNTQPPQRRRPTRRRSSRQWGQPRTRAE